MDIPETKIGTQLKHATLRVASSDAKGAWPELISDLVAGHPPRDGRSPCQFEPIGNDPFDGSITCGGFSGAQFARVAVSPSFYSGLPILGAGLSPLFVALQTNGTGVLGDGALEVSLHPGEWTIFDARKPFVIGSKSPMELIFVNLPGFKPANQAEPLPYPSFSSLGTCGAARLFADFVISVFHEIDHITPSMATSSVEFLTEIVLDSCRTRFPYSVQPLDVLCRRIKAFIEENLSNPDLGPHTIADALGTSVRQVHRAFKSTTNQTVSEYTWQRRVRKCSDELRSLNNANLSVTDIAFRWGFSSSPHFSRAFKEEMGLTASDYRRNMMTQVRLAPPDPAAISHFQP